MKEQFLKAYLCISIQPGSEMMGGTFKLTNISHLRHLDLGNSYISERAMNNLLFSCHNLERLPLAFLNLEHTQKHLPSKWQKNCENWT